MKEYYGGKDDMCVAVAVATSTYHKIFARVDPAVHIIETGTGEEQGKSRSLCQDANPASKLALELH